jgi:hypothetical protein
MGPPRHWASHPDCRRLLIQIVALHTGHEKFPWVTEDLRNGGASRFINVGLWASAEAFHEQIARYFDPAAGKRSFEFELRRRALLTPACWRVGDWRLPIRDSSGVL